MPDQTRPASQTAQIAAAARAAHLIVDAEPWIFADPLAATLLGDRADELIGYHRRHGDHPILSDARAQAICRSRFTEDRVAECARNGIEQYVILGAGLDTFGYRSDPADRLRVFEVDHPATQRWKRRQLAAAGIPVPRYVEFVEADLTVDDPVDRLQSIGFDPVRPAVVSWLGVTPYLTGDQIEWTLGRLGTLAVGSELIVDHLHPPESPGSAGSVGASESPGSAGSAGSSDSAGSMDAGDRDWLSAIMAAVAAMGEPWHTLLRPDQVADLLRRYGFEVIEQHARGSMVEPALWRRTDSLRPSPLAGITRARIRTGSPGDPVSDHRAVSGHRAASGHRAGGLDG
jgi:methyltransferase (TIGR00027 family)